MNEGTSAPEQPSPPSWRSVTELPRAHGEPLVSFRLRTQPEDFIVDEELAFGADGDGEHCLLRVRKTDANTEWAARRLASVAGVPAKAIGYAGLKDRRAVTTQWFSVHLGPRPEPNCDQLAAEGIEVLESSRHRRKLRRGVLAGNRFELLLREVSGDIGTLAERIDRIATAGVPNYFGPQRFGRGQSNLYQADALFREAPRHAEPGQQRRRVSRHLKGLWLSAARSQLFNEVLGLRVERGDWRTALPGERLQLSGSHSHFLAASVDENIRARVDSGDAQPTGPLFGAGDALTAGEVAVMESGVAAAFPNWIDGLAAAGLRQERRPLRLMPEGLLMEQIEADQIRLRFTLPAGSYATALLRELGDWSDTIDAYSGKP